MSKIRLLALGLLFCSLLTIVAPLRVFAADDPANDPAADETALTFCERLANEAAARQNAYDQESEGSQDEGGSPGTRIVARNFLVRTFSYNSLHHRLNCDPLIVGQIKDGKVTSVSVYKIAINLVNFGVLIVLIIIAFANILRIKLDTYAVKKAVPLLILGVVMANLSLPIIRTIVDLSGVITATFIKNVSTTGDTDSFISNLISTVYIGGMHSVGETITAFTSGNSWTGTLSFIGMSVGLFAFVTGAFGPFLLMIILLAVFLILVPAAMFLFLGILFVARILVLVLLTAVAPIAFASLGFEPLKGKVWGWWWQHFIKWTFMAPATFALLWLAIRFHQSLGGEPDLGTYILTMFLVIQATQVPLKMGGSIMAAWNKSLVQPLRDRFFGAAAGAQKLTQVAASRRLSQGTRIGIPFTRITARNPRTGKELQIPPLNVGQMYREFTATREAHQTKLEKGSEAARFGRLLGSAINNTTTGPSDFWSRVTQPQPDRPVSDEALKEQDDIVKETGVGEGGWEDIKDNADLVRRLDERIETAIQSGNTDRIIGAYLANAKLGRILTNDQQKKFVEALRKAGVGNTSIYETIYQRTMRIKQGFSVAAAHGRSDEAVRNEFVVKINAEVAGKKAEDRGEVLYKMAGHFAGLRNKDGRALSLDNQADVHEILNIAENDPTLFGYANALLTQVASLPKDQRDQLQASAGGVFKALNQAPGRFMAVNVTQHLPSTARHLSRATNQDPGRPLDPRYLQTGLSTPVTEANWGSKLEPERRALQTAYLHDDGPAKGVTVKRDLYGMARDQLEQAVRNIGADPGAVSSQIEHYARDITRLDQPNVPPEVANEAGIAEILRPLGKTSETGNVMSHLRTYDLYARSFQTVHEIAQREGLIGSDGAPAHTGAFGSAEERDEAEGLGGGGHSGFGSAEERDEAEGLGGGHGGPTFSSAEERDEVELGGDHSGTFASPEDRDAAEGL